jgi:hypothetical protein
MALIETTSIAAPAKASPVSTPLGGIKAFLARFFVIAFRPYRPELHYMRGPGPAWRAKHGLDAPIRLKPRDL